ncbi:MAG: IS630 family transposase, partial [wastewater metagenome]|nr:IS630 family transposase [Candidatus Loosdrechtia aerotolerans]
MLQLDPKWGETTETLLQKSIATENKRLRERYLALALIVSGKSVQSVARQIHRRRQTVSGWVHSFNQKGIEGLVPEFKSPQEPYLTKEEFEILYQAVQKPPRQSRMKTGRWSGKSVAAYIKKVFGKTVHPHTARRYLRRLGFVLKKPHKKFIKANEKDQKAFAMALEHVEQSRPGKSVTVWIDEGHIWQ